MQTLPHTGESIDNDLFSTSYNPDINEIIRGEISAVEAYEQVLEQITHAPEEIKLKGFYNEHKESVEFWKDQLKGEHLITEESSGIWGLVVEAYVAASTVIGDKATLTAIKQGEEHGFATYVKMLESNILNNFQKKIISDKFIPRQKSHIDSLKVMIEKC